MKRKRVLLLLCILSCTLQLFAQQINVQGIVYDPSGETVPGANVSMKSNPAVGTVTDIDGNFSLKASVGDVLVFTFIGYEPIYNPQIQISAESETKRSIFREKDKTKRSKKESAQHSKSRNKSFVMTSVSAL